MIQCVLVVDGDDFMADQKSDYTQLKDEYQFLMDHYFYEGGTMLRRNQFFVALNLGLFTILGFLSGDNTSVNFTPVLLPMLCVLGAFISLSWTIMTWRANWYIEARVQRVRDIEERVGYEIMRVFDKRDAKWHTKPSTWILFIVLGYIFAVSWAILFFVYLN